VDRVLAALEDLVHTGLLDVLADPHLVRVPGRRRRGLDAEGGGAGRGEGCDEEEGDGA
jgi:hypothetical protein